MQKTVYFIILVPSLLLLQFLSSSIPNGFILLSVPLRGISGPGNQFYLGSSTKKMLIGVSIRILQQYIYIFFCVLFAFHISFSFHIEIFLKICQHIVLEVWDIFTLFSELLTVLVVSNWVTKISWKKETHPGNHLRIQLIIMEWDLYEFICQMEPWS